ncbi:MAG: CCA tRNA nucleotidyltransferase [Anaerovoracaceae bacterium]|jgi:tRNA nucleotidyltransferase (CCA-adding enzyme)
MITLPKEILRMIKVIEDAGFQAYVVGGSVRDALMGHKPEDWDLACSAPMEKILELFTEAIILGKKYGVVQIIMGEVIADVAAMRIDGSYTDHRRPDEVVFTEKIEKDLIRRDFTINGMAFHPKRGLIDPFSGLNDLKDRQIQTIGDPEKRFSEDPLRILRGIRLSGQLDFDINKEVFLAIQKTVFLLNRISMDRKLQEFEKLLKTKNAGKALNLCASTGVMPNVLWNCFPPRERQEYGDFRILLNNINKSEKRIDLRMALLLLCFEKQAAIKAIEDMNYSGIMAKKLKAALNLMNDFELIEDKYNLKRFIYINGEDIYYFLNELSKQLRDVYDIPNSLIEIRYDMLVDIRKNKEPIYMNQLAIKGQDLIEAGIAEGEQIGKLLTLLIDEVHKYPVLNSKSELLKKAKELKKL